MFQHDRPDIRFIDATLIDRFLAPEHRDTHTFEAYDQRAVVLIVLWILACGVWFVPLYGFLLDAWPSAIAVALCCSAVFGGLFTLRWTGTTLWSCNITCLALTAILTWLSLRTGGIASAPAFWLLLVPVSAHALYHNRHFTVGWAVAALAALGFIYTVKRLDGSFSVLSNAENDLLFLAGTIGLLFAVLQIVNIRHGFERWLYESVRRREVARREAEAELRRANEESRERARQSLRALIENSPDAIIVHQSGQIIYTNAAARELVGYSEDELHQMTVEDLVDEAELERVRERVASLRDASALPLREMEVVRKDGTRVAVEATAFKGTFDGDEAVLSTLRDLTERRALRAKMMQMDRMIAVGTLATGVAHEINNPLSFVRSNLEFLSTRLVGEEEADQDESDQGESAVLEGLSLERAEEVLTDAVEGTKRIESIVSDLGTFSARAASGTSQNTDIEETLESAIELAQNKVQKRANLVRDFAGLPVIEANEAELAQVFLNLLLNAAQAIPEGAPSEHEIRITTRVEDETARIDIRDTGRGIDEEVLANIFDPFYSTKSPGQGTGLGLSITHNIVTSLGGSLEVETEVGEGSTFSVILPLEPDTDDATAPNRPASTNV